MSHQSSTPRLLPDGHPAHALLSVAHALLGPASHIANPALEKTQESKVLPIEDLTMPGEDVSDLRDVVDAINRLCDGMKTSSYDDNDVSEPEGESDVVVTSIHSQVVEIPRYVEYREMELVNPEEISVQKVETYSSENWSTEAQTVESPERTSEAPVQIESEKWSDTAQGVEPAGNEFVPIQKVESYSSERWSDHSFIQKAESYSETSSIQRIESYTTERWSDSSQISLPGQMDDVETDTEPAAAQCEPASEMYYTASSEVSLLSDLEGPEKPTDDIPDSDKREVVAIAGHVAAMRERFESMTRANTPCPDLVRSMSPTTLDRKNVTPSPDHLG